MYLYFNKKGTLTTIIPHGDSVRQGNNLNLTFCVDTDFFDDKTPNSALSWTVNVSIRQPGQKDSNGPFLPKSQGVHKFLKTLDSEITYDLKNGTNYYMYFLEIPSKYSTSIAGEIEAFISFHSFVKDEHDQVVLVNHEFEGRANLFVEKTLGYGQKITAITQTQYEYLLNQINSLQISNQQIIDIISGTTVDIDPFIKRYPSVLNFPNIGDNKTVYIADDTLEVYIWGGVSTGFKSICNFDDIEKIDGGNAYGRKNNA